MHFGFSAPKMRTPARWPFWLLVAAWFCANTPQQVIYGAALWLANGRHFSHQERLRTDVIGLLTGKKTNPLLALAKSGPVPMPAAPLPPTDSLKKIDLYTADKPEPIAPPRLGAALPITAWRVPENPLPEPLLPPPKAAVAS